jgi:hypothetical protein
MSGKKVQTKWRVTKVILLRRYFVKKVVHQKEKNGPVLSVQTITGGVVTMSNGCSVSTVMNGLMFCTQKGDFITMPYCHLD